MNTITEEEREYLRKAVRPMQIIVFALAMGVVTMAPLLLMLGGNLGGGAGGGGGQQPDRTLTYAALGMSVVCLVASVAVPNVIGNTGRQAVAEGRQPAVPSRRGFFANTESEIAYNSQPIGKLAGLFQTRLIVGGALCEGPALFCLIAFMLEQSPLSLAMAAFLVFCILLRFPTATRLENWIAGELEAIEQLKMRT